MFALRLVNAHDRALELNGERTLDERRPSSVAELDLAVFTVASVLARGLRFFIVAALLWYFGPPIKAFVERYLGWVVLVFCVLLVAGFVVLKFVL